MWYVICFLGGCFVTFLAGVISWYHLEVEKRKKEFNDSMNEPPYHDNFDWDSFKKEKK